MPKTYTRLSPETYELQRCTLMTLVRDGVALETAARRHGVPLSTARYWAQKHGFRRIDLAAEAEGRPRPPAPHDRRAKDRGETGPQEDLLAPEHPELAGMRGPERLTRLNDLAAAAEAQAARLIANGYVREGLAAAADSGRYRRGWRMLRDAMEDPPQTQEDEEKFWDDLVARARAQAPEACPPWTPMADNPYAGLTGADFDLDEPLGGFQMEMAARCMATIDPATPEGQAEYAANLDRMYAENAAARVARYGPAGRPPDPFALAAPPRRRRR